ncbi:MAG: DedA family protein [Xanthomonadaceae bacterium]|nr:DedA family protein [Xanthomonadaceae bacterium]
MKTLLIASSGVKAYAIYFFILMSCSYGFPFNSDLLMVIGGALASLGVFQIGAVMILSPIFILMGDSVSFYVGRKFGVKILASRYIQKVFPFTRQEKLKSLMRANARQFCFMIRFIPGFRTFVFVFAGTMRIEPKIFYQMNALSTFLYCPTIVWLSYSAANQLQEVDGGFQNYTKWIMIIAGFVALMFIVKQLSRKFWLQEEGAK